MPGRFYLPRTASPAPVLASTSILWSRLLGPRPRAKQTGECVACHVVLVRKAGTEGHAELCRECSERSHTHTKDYDIGGES